MENIKIAYLGPKGSFTYEASIKYFGENNLFIPVNRIIDIFDEVMLKEVDFGVVPAENSIGGSIADTLDLFTNTKLKVYDQITLQINHNLLSNTDRSSVKKIYSHPQSFLQCSIFLKRQFPEVELIETLSNAKAAIIAKNEPESAAIGPAFCAGEYNLKLLEENINDSKNNETKFFILGKEINTVKKNKSLIFISVPNKSGSLFEILKIFKKNKINMTRIESRPSKNKNWEYVFIIEYENSQDKKVNEKLIKKLKLNCDFFDYLGSF